MPLPNTVYGKLPRRRSLGGARACKRADQFGSIAETDAQCPGGLHGRTIWVDPRERSDRVGDWHTLDVRWAVANHLTKLAVVNEPHGVGPKLSGEYSVKRGWIAASLQVPQHLKHHNSFVARSRRMEPIERVGGLGHGGVEAEREGRCTEVR